MRRVAPAAVALLASALLSGSDAAADPPDPAGEEGRNRPGLTDPMDGVWVYPEEQPGRTTVTVVKDMWYATYPYSASRIDPEKSVRRGRVLGQEGVYFFPDAASYYSPRFYLTSRGQKFLILNKLDYDHYVKHGEVNVRVLIRVADELDPAEPPARPSVEILGLPRSDAPADRPAGVPQPPPDGPT